MLVGCSLIAGVLHLGLSRIARELTGAQSATAPGAVSAVRAEPLANPAAAAAAAPAAAAPAAVPVVAPALLRRDAEARARDQAFEAIQPQLAALRECTRGKLTTGSMPAPVQLDVSLKLDAQGRELSREYALPARGSPPETLTCLHALKLPRLQVPAPGFETTVELGIQ